MKTATCTSLYDFSTPAWMTDTMNTVSGMDTYAWVYRNKRKKTSVRTCRELI